LRNVFVSALVMDQITEPPSIWTTFCRDMCDDLPAPAAALGVSVETDAHLDYGLFHVRSALVSAGKSLDHYSLPSAQHDWDRIIGNYHPPWIYVRRKLIRKADIRLDSPLQWTNHPSR
jgi:hypothetical protein